MPPTVPARRFQTPAKPRPNWLLRLIVLAGLALAAYYGYDHWKKLHAGDIPPGSLRIPSAAVTIPAYAQVTYGEIGSIIVPESAVKAAPTLMLRAVDINARVTRVAIPAGAPFAEGLFAPLGTPPGVPGIVPAGKVATTIDVTKVEGAVNFLEPGFHVDIATTRKFPVRGGGGGVTPYESRVIAHDAVVVMPVRQRMMPGQAGLMSGAKMMPSFELTVACTETEALALAEEMEQARVRILVRSGRPSPAPTSVTPTAAPAEPPPRASPVIEIDEGGKLRSEVPPRE